MHAVDNELYALRLTFYEEAEERLAELEESLRVLAEHADDRDILNSIFRAVHSIKGGSAACDHGELTQYAHAFENLLSSLRKGALAVDGRLLEVLLQAKDVLDALVCAAREHREGAEAVRVARSLSAISAELSRLPQDEAEIRRPEDLVDLSAGFAIWDAETDPSPACAVAPAAQKSAHPSVSGMRTIPPAPRGLQASLPPRESRLSLVPKKSPSRHATAPRPTGVSPDRPMDGVVVRVGLQLYVLPTERVERFVQPELSALHLVPKAGELLVTEFGAVPLLSLEALLGRTPACSVAPNRVAVLLRTGKKHVALLVDEVLTQGDVAVKCIAQNVGLVRGVSGAVVLEQGVALVLECDALLASAGLASLCSSSV